MKPDVYTLVTEKVMALLAEGTAPWRQTWRGSELPSNLVSGKPYRGINLLLLSMNRFASPYWLTFNQAQQLGGHIKKGAKSELVVFWKFFDKASDDADDAGHANTQRRPPLLRYYCVFNAEQTEGLERHLPQPEAANPFTPLEQAAEIIAAMPQRPAIYHHQQLAYYAPQRDYINLPRPETFALAEHYYAVAFHELTHATGHETRLHRPGVAGTQLAAFGSPDYSREELIAEMGSAFLCATAGIANTLENSAAYLQGWLVALQGDSRLIVTAASAAQKAADFILGLGVEPGSATETNR